MTNDDEMRLVNKALEFIGPPEALDCPECWPEGEYACKRCRPDEIRPYGLGKFATILDSYVYSVSLDGGPDEQCGDVDETGRWYGMMRGSILRDPIEGDPLLNSAERAALAKCAGVILSEDSQGFVDVEYYDSLDALNKDWALIEADVAACPD